MKNNSMTMYENVKLIAKDYVTYVKKIDESKKPVCIKLFLIKIKYKRSIRAIKKMVKKVSKYIKTFGNTLNSTINLAEDIFNNMIKFNS